MRITADSFYRLSVNGQWVADGPCRCWPEHFQYDVLDVSNYLRDGNNQLEIVARYYGVGDFHKVPKRPGLLAQPDVVSADGRQASCITDDFLEDRRDPGVGERHAESQRADGALRPLQCAIGRRLELQPGAGALRGRWRAVERAPPAHTRC